MISTGCLHSSRALLAAGLALLMASCAGTKVHPAKGGEVTKVKYFYLEQSRRNQNALRGVQDQSIVFERDHFLYGAISNEERIQREGNYYTVFTRVDDVSQPVTVRFEFRQKGSGLAVKKFEQVLDKPKRHNATDFAVNGSDFQLRGPVTAWKASLVRGKEVLHETKSFMWERQ